MLDMGAANVDNLVDMLVVKAIENIFALAAVFDQFALTQGIELMRNSGFAHLEHGSQITNAHFRLRQRPHNSDAGRIAKDFEQGG